jgi:2-haloacid dehalogenase
MRHIAVLKVFLILLAVSSSAVSQDRRIRTPRFKAVAFDYFVIFDPSSIAPFVEREFPGKGREFTRAWQSRQFDYAFLRTITGEFRDFFQVTGDALDYTAEAMNLTLSPEARTRLLNAYLMLTPWPDAASGLRELRNAGVKIITIANFSSEMLRKNADRSGITDLFDELLSTEVNQTYKPDAKAYELGLKRLHLRKRDVVFAAFGGWDVYGAKTFGYRTFWMNRFGLPVEKLGITPDGASGDFQGLLDFVLGKETPAK